MVGTAGRSSPAICQSRCCSARWTLAYWAWALLAGEGGVVAGEGAVAVAEGGALEKEEGSSVPGVHRGGRGQGPLRNELTKFGNAKK